MEITDLLDIALIAVGAVGLFVAGLTLGVLMVEAAYEKRTDQTEQEEQ